VKERLHIFWYYEVAHRAEKARERIITGIAWALPRELVMWCFVRVAAHATMGEYGNNTPDNVSIMDALQRWRS
jgi:hypothetical protein